MQKESIEKKFELETEVPYEINGIKLSEETRELLSKGQFSEYLEGMVFEDGSVKNGKIKLSKDVVGEIEILYHFKKEKLIIPSRIGDYELSNEDKVLLMQNKTTGPILYNEQNIYLQVDPDLNSIIVKNESQLSMSEIIQAKYDKFGEFKIGNVYLSSEQVNDLVSGRQLPNMVYFDSKTNQHFLAKINLTPDGHGIKFIDFQTISPQKAKELEPLLNKNSRNIEKAINVATEISKDPSLEKEFYTALEKKDFNKIEELSNKGFRPTEKTIENISSMYHLSSHDINQIQQIFGMEVSANKILKAETLLNSATEISNSSLLHQSREQNIVPEPKDGFLEPGNTLDPDFMKMDREQKLAQLSNAITKHDFKALNELKEQGFHPTREELDKQITKSSLTEEQKIGVKTIFNVQPDGEVGQPHTKSVEEKSKGIEISENKQKVPIQKENQKAYNGQKTKAAANAIEKGFSNM